MARRKRLQSVLHYDPRHSFGDVGLPSKRPRSLDGRDQ